MTKLKKTKIISEYYIQKIGNDYAFIFDVINKKYFLEDCILAGYFFENKALIIYLETEFFITRIEFHEINNRNKFKLRRKEELIFIENDEIAFNYKLKLIKNPNKN
jgi:hypothetical protein